MINCLCTKCIHNEEGACLNGDVTITPDGECVSSEDEEEEE